MRRDFCLCVKLDGAFLPRWLLACATIKPGAKIAYAWLSQLADEDNSVFVCLGRMAQDLGVAESQVAGFILQLREYGFIRMDEPINGKQHIWCILSEPPQAKTKILSGEKVKGRLDSRLSHQPLSRYDFETCIAYVKRCKEEGEQIESVYALAQYLHRTGAQDEMIALVLGLTKEKRDIIGQSDVLPFEPKHLQESPANIQDETDLDQ